MGPRHDLLVGRYTTRIGQDKNGLLFIYFHDDFWVKEPPPFRNYFRQKKEYYLSVGLTSSCDELRGFLMLHAPLGFRKYFRQKAVYLAKRKAPRAVPRLGRGSEVSELLNLLLTGAQYPTLNTHDMMLGRRSLAQPDPTLFDAL